MIKTKQGLLKWMGGKKWLGKTLHKHATDHINKNVNIYIEPFVGGLGSFFALYPLLKEHNIQKIVLNDINEVLILLYKTVKDFPQELFNEFKRVEKNYQKIIPKEVSNFNKKDKDVLKILLKSGYDFFQDTKKVFNELKKNQNRTQMQNIKLAALLLFLNKHSFNGIYRENSSGEYNTSFNWNNIFINIENIENIINTFSEFFNNNDIIFENMDVFDLLNKYNDYENSFIYLDPPYLNMKGGENKYNKDFFSYQKQFDLLDVLKLYKNFIYSNHYFEEFKEYFSQKNHSFILFDRKNIMSPIDRSIDAKEILGFKYDK